MFFCENYNKLVKTIVIAQQIAPFLYVNEIDYIFKVISKQGTNSVLSRISEIRFLG